MKSMNLLPTVLISLSLVCVACERNSREINETPASSMPVETSPPHDAISAHDAVYKTIKAGSGRVVARLGQGQICNLTYVEYDAHGNRIRTNRAPLQDLDGYSQHLRSVLVGMRGGEVRRVWTTSDAYGMRIVDVEMEAVSEPQSRDETAADRALKRIKTVSSTRPVTWDPPADAIVAGSSRYVVLKAGKGHEPVRADKGIICNIAYVVYGRDGKQVTASAAWLQDYDGYRPEMRSVLGGMTAGEIRRAWITERNGKKRVIDIEMSSLFIDRPEPSPATRPESRSPR